MMLGCSQFYSKDDSGTEDDDDDDGEDGGDDHEEHRYRTVIMFVTEKLVINLKLYLRAGS